MTISEETVKQYLGRGFNVVLDWSLFGDAESYLEDSLGRTRTLVLGFSYTLSTPYSVVWPFRG